MSDQSTSGDRPTSGEQTTPPDPTTAEPTPAEPTPAEPTPAEPTAPPSTDEPGQPAYTSARRMSGRSRAIIAGAALGLVGVGGLGGYAIGAATGSGDGDGETRVVDVRDRGDRDGRMPGHGPDGWFGGDAQDADPGSNT